MKINSIEVMPGRTFQSYWTLPQMLVNGKYLVGQSEYSDFIMALESEVEVRIYESKGYQWVTMKEGTN